MPCRNIHGGKTVKYRVNKTAIIAGLAFCLTGVAGMVQAADEPANVIK